MRITPALGSINLLMCLTRVDLPDPESPIRQNISPLFTLKDASFTPTTAPNCSKTSAFPNPLVSIAAIASLARSPNTFQTF